MQLRKCLARAKSFRQKIKKKNPNFDWYFWFSKKAKCVKKAWISKFGLLNGKLATLPATNDRMRPLLTDRGNCCVTRPGIGRPWLSEEIRTVRFMVFLQFLAYYLILLDLQLINFPRAWTIFREVPSQFPHFLQPCMQGCQFYFFKKGQTFSQKRPKTATKIAEKCQTLKKGQKRAKPFTWQSQIY